MANVADGIPSRLGRKNNVNGNWDADNALFLKVYAGEVLASFEQTTVLKDKHTVRTISHGKSAQFPVIGRAKAEYHQPGELILGGIIKHNERVITIDDVLLSAVFVAKIDDAKNHYDVRSQYSLEQGRVLAYQMDKHLFQVAINSARDAVPLINDPDQNGGTVINGINKNNPEDLAAAMFQAAKILDEKYVPAENRYLFLRPEQYYTIIQSKKIINRDYGGSGSYSEGKVFRCAGIDIYNTNNLPSGVIANDTTGAGTQNKYVGDYTNTIGLVMHPSAIGTVKLLDLSMEADYDITRQGTLMVAKYAVGHGSLRVDAAIELSSLNAIVTNPGQPVVMDKPTIPASKQTKKNK